MRRGGGLGQVAGGMVALGLGIALTLISYHLASPGGTYFIFVGLIFSGSFMIFRGLVMPGATVGKVRTRRRPAVSSMSGYVAPPVQMPRGYCWQCGRKVKAQRAICLGCGATQVRGTPLRHADNSVHQNDWDRTASTPASVTSWESPPPSRGPTPAEQWGEPVYPPRAPGAWDAGNAGNAGDVWGRPPDASAQPGW